MASAPPSGPLRAASPQFLREAEIRRGIELLFFGSAHLFRAIDDELDAQGLGRAHQRALYFIARKPDLTVGELLHMLAITKQSLGRVLNDLSKRGLVDSQPGLRDRRQKLLRLTPSGAELEARLYDRLREKLSSAYASAGQGSVTGFWGVLEGLVPVEERVRIANLGRGK